MREGRRAGREGEETPAGERGGGGGAEAAAPAGGRRPGDRGIPPWPSQKRPTDGQINTPHGDQTALDTRPDTRIDTRLDIRLDYTHYTRH